MSAVFTPRGTLTAALAATLLYASPAARQKPTFSSKVEVVRVDVLVSQGGQPLRGLRVDDFDVFDNGVRQQIDFLVSGEVDSSSKVARLPLNVVLALDISDSIRGERLEHLRAAGMALVDRLTPQDQAALVTFNQVVRMRVPLTGDLGAVRNALPRISPSGNTALFDAAYAGMVLGESDVGRNLLILFTDGADTSSFLTREAVVEAAKRTEVVVYAAAVGKAGCATFLKDITDQTGGAVLPVESTRDLPDAFLRILEEFRHRYLLSYSPRNVGKGGWHRIDVRVKGRRADVKARPGYQAER